MNYIKKKKKPGSTCYTLVFVYFHKALDRVDFFSLAKPAWMQFDSNFKVFFLSRSQIYTGLKHIHKTIESIDFWPQSCVIFFAILIPLYMVECMHIYRKVILFYCGLIVVWLFCYFFVIFVFSCFFLFGGGGGLLFLFVCFFVVFFFIMFCLFVFLFFACLILFTHMSWLQHQFNIASRAGI